MSINYILIKLTDYFINKLNCTITYSDWYYMVNHINRISQRVNTQHVKIQQLAELPTIILNKNNIGPWIDHWIVQDNLKQQLINI
jgi:hypothetical protein